MKCLLYATKEADLVHFAFGDGSYQSFKTGEDWENSNYNPNDIALYNGKGKIVAEFESKCERIQFLAGNPFSYSVPDSKLKLACLTYEQLEDCLFPKSGCAIHISKLKVFNKPLELRDCKKAKRFYLNGSNWQYYYYNTGLELEKAPKNMCYVWYKGKLCVLISFIPESACKILNGEKTIEIRRKVLKEML